MVTLGNARINRIYEASYDPSKMKRATAKSERSERERWISSKYVGRLFVMTDALKAEAEKRSYDERFWDACEAGDFLKAILYLALGAHVDFAHPGHDDQSALHRAIARKDAAMIQFLMFWNANLSMADRNGWTPLHFVVNSSNTKLLTLLLKRNVDISCKTVDNKVSVHCIRTFWLLEFRRLPSTWRWIWLTPKWLLASAFINSS
jgi:hypothetical protein